MVIFSQKCAVFVGTKLARKSQDLLWLVLFKFHIFWKYLFIYFPPKITIFELKPHPLTSPTMDFQEKKGWFFFVLETCDVKHSSVVLAEKLIFFQCVKTNAVASGISDSFFIHFWHAIFLNIELYIPQDQI